MKKIWIRLLSLALALVLVAVLLPSFAMEAEAAVSSNSVTIDGLTYTFSLTTFTVGGNNYLPDVTSISFSDCERTDNTISLQIKVQYSDGYRNRAYSFTDADCGQAITNLQVEDSYAPTNTFVCFNVSRAAADHTGGQATCSAKKVCTVCNQE